MHVKRLPRVRQFHHLVRAFPLHEFRVILQAALLLVLAGKQRDRRVLRLELGDLTNAVLSAGRILDRLGEAEQVVDTITNKFNMKLVHTDASKHFMSLLEGVTEPEKKRKTIGAEFIHTFQEEANKLEDVKFLVQGTLYPDVVESGTATASTIKSHHNVGGLPKDMKFSLIEPLRELFKDEVRELGRQLGLPEEVVNRQPFPGPGLAIRIIGDITPERLDILRRADFIVRDVIHKHGLDNTIWQSFAVLPAAIRSVGVQGDERTYDYTVGIRAVTSSDGMTADYFRFPWEVLDEMSRRICNEVAGVNRVVYDITSKPPSTIEWE